MFSSPSTLNSLCASGHDYTDCLKIVLQTESGQSTEHASIWETPALIYPVKDRQTLQKTNCLCSREQTCTWFLLYASRAADTSFICIIEKFWITRSTWFLGVHATAQRELKWLWEQEGIILSKTLLLNLILSVLLFRGLLGIFTAPPLGLRVAGWPAVEESRPAGRNSTRN